MTTSKAPPVVLLVEDDIFVRMTTLDMLEDAGCRVLEAASGAEAFNLFDEADVVDLLVSDIGLPDIGGLELYATCLDACPGLPVIFVTGYGAQDLETDLADRPLVSVLGKPYQMRELTRVIHTALAAAHQGQHHAKGKLKRLSTTT